MNLKEDLIAFGIFGGILLSTRLVFYHFFSHYWYGVVGVLSIVVFTLFYFSKKGKLGYVGNVLIKRIFARIRGRRFKIFLIQSIFGIYLFSMFTIGANYADQEKVTEFKTALQKDNINDTQSLINADMKHIHEINPSTIPMMLLMLIIPNHVLFTVLSVINQITDGWFISFNTIALVEEIEFLGIILYFRYKKEVEKLNH